MTTALACLGALVAAPDAQAASMRVSIANYAWSRPQVQVNLGERVTWDWIGPDLAHSVTGISANDLQRDSDPGTDAPSHRAGDSYTLQFSQPGTYLFQCKLHASVRGRGNRRRRSRRPQLRPRAAAAAERRPEAADPGRRQARPPELQGQRRRRPQRPDQRARQPRRRVLPPQLQGQARLQRLQGLGGLHRHQPFRAGRPLEALPGQAGAL